MSEFNDGGLAERGGGGVASPGGPNTAGGGGGQANRSGMGLGVNSGSGWANNPYSNNRNPGGVFGGLPGNFSGFNTTPVRRSPYNPVTGQPIPINPITGQPVEQFPNLYEYNYDPLSSIGVPGVYGWPSAQGGYTPMSPDQYGANTDFPGGYSEFGGNWQDLNSGYGNQTPDTPDYNAPGSLGGYGRMAATSSFAADPNAPSGIMTMMGGQPGGQGRPMGRPMRPPGPMINPGPIGPGGQPGVDPRIAQRLAFHQAMRDWKGQRPQDRNDMAAWDAWRNARPDRPEFGSPRPPMAPPQRQNNQAPLRRFIEQRMAERAARKAAMPKLRGVSA